MNLNLENMQEGGDKKEKRNNKNGDKFKPNWRKRKDKKKIWSKWRGGINVSGINIGVMKGACKGATSNKNRTSKEKPDIKTTW
jgi:hypothetical protein